MTTTLPEALVDAMGDLQPYYEAAEGQKVELIRRGWGEPAAECIAAEIACGLVRLVFAQLIKSATA